MISWAFLLVSLVGAVFTANAFFPARRLPAVYVPSFFGSWLTTELAGQHVLWQGAASAAFIWFGALERWPGWLGAAITVASWLGLVVLFVQGRRTAHTFDEVLSEVAPERPETRFPALQVAFAVPFRRRGVRVTKNVTYRKVAGKRVKLDVYAPAGPGERRPALLQVHGGGWVIGDKREQGLPLIGHLAAAGWVCFNANYRLSPGATFPDHLVDLKYALKWIREHADEWGVDPDFIAVTGGSAGGHLTALLALTQNDPEYQPGFPDADTSVQAAVPFYGVYDFTNEHGQHHPDFQRVLLEPMVMKAFFDEQPELFRAASPLARVNESAPPFLVVHGSRDTLAPVSDARRFVELLRKRSRQPVIYAELRGAQHAFDVFCSPRTARAVEGVERFLTAMHRRAKASAREPAEARAAAE